MSTQKNAGPAQRADAYEAREADHIGDEITSVSNGHSVGRQRLALFAVRCRQMVERVNVGAIPFIWAVDALYEAALWSGLVDDVGDDIVQEVMAEAFMGAHRP